MLILARQIEEEVVINHGQVVVKVVEIRGRTVRLGFTAAREVPIHRREVQSQIEEAKVAAENQAGDSNQPQDSGEAAGAAESIEAAGAAITTINGDGAELVSARELAVKMGRRFYE